MKLSVRVFLGFFLIVALAAYFVLAIFMQEVKPGVRQGMEVTLVDTAHLLAEVVAPELEAGNLGEGALGAAIQRYRTREPRARIWGLPKTGADFRVYVTDAKGSLLFDSEGEKPGADYSRWNDVLLTLRGQYGVRSTRRDPKDASSSVMYVAAPILVGGRISGVLSVGTATSSVVPFAQRSERKVYHAGLVLMGAALLMGLGMTFWLTRSLQRLQGYARRVSEGEKATPPALGGELAELGEALETMREKLEGRHYVERYVHTLTHEMKSPLAAIHGAAELLEEELSEADRQRFLANIREQDERLQRLVERMLNLATLENRQALDRPQRLSLPELIQGVCRTREPQMALRGLHLRLELPQESWTQGDPFLLELAISNLLDNALEFSPGGGEVLLRLEPMGGGHLLTLRDQGPGIPDFAVDRVFEPFYSLPRPSTGKKSTGLGLRFVREVAKLHGGDADLLNAPEGGAEARLWLHTRFT
ncbi:two-component system sensor histidine kinase CreC [Holophaga foetida]|uniref:two-component system sensor histidine kinase CreC n=1 Tax=Holophaga foetida TaxID=35839 RepID=UPI00024742CF|nr:two-component system sensor histidine kinase CreC [Holophaga foetida]